MTSTVWAYLRLSRDEAETPGLLEEKFQRMEATARELAARHHLVLPDDHILREQESGKRLRNRPVLLRLMERMHAGLCTHLITPFQDRVDRLEDKREQADLEDALYAGCVTLLSRDDVTRYDDDLDPLPAEVRALIARHELRLYVRRRREANRQRLRQNARTSGQAPWGYRRDPTAVGGYALVPEEYVELEAVFRRVLMGESLRAVLHDLQARQVPTPGARRRKNAAQTWDFSTLYEIVHNPFYAGYHARRTRWTRQGQRKLSPDEYELPDTEPGGWTCPITLADWYRIRERYAVWRARSRPRTALLTGLLYCPAGSRMRAAGAGRAYGCLCEGETHYTNRPRWDAFARRLVVAFVEAVPPGLLDVPVEAEETARTDRAQLRQQLDQAVRRVSQAEQDARAMLQESERQRRLLGEAMYEAVLRKTREGWESARREAEALRALLDAPERHEALRLLQAVRTEGIESVWDANPVDARRRLLGQLVRRLVLWPAPGRMRHYRGVTVEWQEWVQQEGLAIPIPDDWFRIPRRGGPRANDRTTE